MVQMANQETALNTAHYAPQVNYNQSAKAPMPERREPNVDTKSDWAGAIANAFTTLGTAYIKGASERQKQELETAQQQAYTNLAEKYSRVVQQQRQGIIDPFTAETKIRVIDQEGLQSGIGWKEVKDIRNAYAGKLPDLEVERQKYYNEEMWKTRSAEMEDISKNNIGFQRLSTDKRYAFMNNTAASLDYIGRMNEQLSVLDPSSDEYRSAKEQYTNAVKDNTSLNLMLYISNELANDKDIRESTIAEGKIKAVEYARTQLGMSATEAGVVYDMTVKDLGLDQIAGMNKSAMSLSLDEIKKANDLKIANTKYNLYSIPEIPVIEALKLTDAMNVRVAAGGAGQKMMDSAVVNVSNLIANGSYEEAARQIPVEHVPAMMSSVNSTLSSANASSYMKAKVGNTAMSAFLEATAPNVNDSQEQQRVKFLNMQGIRRGINLDAIKNQAEIMSKDKDPAVSKEGMQLKDKVEKLKAGEDYYSIVSSPWYSDVNVIFRNEAVRDNLRYNQNGELFFKEPDYSDNPIVRVMEAAYGRKFSQAAQEAAMSDFTTRTVGSKGTLFEKISKMNNIVLSGTGEDVEERKKLYEAFGVRAAEVGDAQYNFATDEDNYLTKLKNFFSGSSNPAADLVGVAGQTQPLEEQPVTATATVSNSSPLANAGGVISAEEMKELDEAYNKQVAEELIRRADALEESTANLDAEGKKEYSKGNKKIIERARKKAAELLTASASVSNSSVVGGASVAVPDYSEPTQPTEQTLAERMTELRDTALDHLKDIFHTEYTADDLNKLQARLRLANRVNDKEHAEKLMKEIEKIMPEVKYKRDKELINRYMSTLQEMILSDNPEMRQNGIDFMQEILR